MFSMLKTSINGAVLYPLHIDKKHICFICCSSLLFYFITKVILKSFCFVSVLGKFNYTGHGCEGNTKAKSSNNDRGD